MGVQLYRYQVLWHVLKGDGTTSTTLCETTSDNAWGAILRTAPDLKGTLKEDQKVVGCHVNETGLVSPFARENGSFQPRELR